MTAPLKNKVLVAYFSYSGNTRKIARQIQKQSGGDIFEIQPVTDYPASYNKVLDRAKQEIKSGAKPLLRKQVVDMNHYETIFLGFPNWWNTFPAPVNTFLAEYDWNGKTIIPFCTHGGGGTGRSLSDIKRICSDSTIMDGLSIPGDEASHQNPEITALINQLTKNN